MFIKRAEYEKMKARNAFLEKEVAGYKEIIDLQNSEDMEKVQKYCKEKEKSRYCAACKHGIKRNILMAFTSRNQEEYVLCSLQGKIVCSNFQRANEADDYLRYNGDRGSTSAT